MYSKIEVLFRQTIETFYKEVAQHRRNYYLSIMSYKSNRSKNKKFYTHTF